MAAFVLVNLTGFVFLGARGLFRWVRGLSVIPLRHLKKEVVMVRIALLVALACGLLPPPALAKNFRWSCVYIADAAPKGLSKEEFKLEFLHDDVTGKAVIVGNAGMADVDLHTGYFGVTFLEKLPSGVVQTTTIAESGASVHSRHTIFGVDKKITPSQFYGQCRFVQ